MEVTTGPGPGYVLVRARGHLTRQTAPILRDELLAAFAEQPLAVVCDLTDVDASPMALSALIRVANQVRSWPASPLVLHVGQTELGRRLREVGLADLLVVVETFDEASAVVLRRPPLLQAALSLTPSPQAPAAARRFVRGCLSEWDLAYHADDADLVVDELAANAVQHSNTPFDVRVSRQGGRLGVAVGDHAGAEPTVRGPSRARESGRGMMLVQALADGWGVLPRRGGGKVVWTVLRERRPDADAPRLDDTPGEALSAATPPGGPS